MNSALSFAETPPVSPTPAVMPTPSYSNSHHGLLKEEVLTSEELRAILDKGEPIILIDARDDKSYNAMHIQGAVLSLPAEYFRQRELHKQGILPTPPKTETFLSENMAKYPKNAAIVTYCNANCGASAALLFTLRRLGYSNLRSMEDGVQGWQAKGYPVVISASETNASAVSQSAPPASN